LTAVDILDYSAPEPGALITASAMVRDLRADKSPVITIVTAMADGAK
jgi:hypothetical protein